MVNRRTWAVLAAAVLVLTALPFTAASQTVTVSAHTTDADFNSGSLTNLVVEGSGTGASVALPAPFDAYNPVYAQGDGSAGSFHQLVGDTSGNAHVSTSVQIQPNATGTIAKINPFVGTEYVDYDLNVDIYAIQESVDSDIQEGTLLKSDWTPSAGSGRQSIDLDTPLDVQQGETWTISFVTTNSDNDGSLDGIDVDRDLSGGTDWIYSSESGFRNGYLDIEYQYQATSQNGTYTSATHTVGEATQAFGNVTLSDAEISYEWQYNDGGTWTTGASGTWTTSGNHTVSLPDVSASDWRLYTEFNVTGPSATAQLHDEGVQFDATAPNVLNDTADPSGGEELTSATETFEIVLEDADFPTAQGDQLTAELYLDGTAKGTDTLTSNGSASVTATVSAGGAHSYYWEVTDSYGLTTTSDTFQFATPGEVYIRNELDHSELIDAPITINGTFFGDDIIVIRDGVTNGVINMSGLPVDQNYILVAEPSGPHWTQRALYVESIYQQESLYLLNATAASTVDSRFVLNDPTGEYDASSVLYIQRPINVSGNTTWQTIHSDRFGVEGVSATLEEEQRYRIRVSNDAGVTQVVGPYRPRTSETVQVQPGVPTIELGPVTEGWAANAELLNDTLEYRFADPHNETDRLTVWIHETGNRSNQLAPNSTYFDLGEASAQESLTANQTDMTWTVVFVIDRDGERIVYTETVSNRQDLFGAMGEGWQLMIGIGTLFLLAGAFSLLNASVGAVVVSLMGGLLWWIGLLDGATTGIAVMIAIVFSAAIHAQNAAGP